MITKIEISGFKSFSGFSLEFTPFTLIAGTNASGKSNLFDALKLLSNLASSDLRTAFSFPEQRGSIDEMFSLYSKEKTISTMSFAVELLVNRRIQDNWGGVEEIKTPRLRYELIIARKKNERGYEELYVKHERLSKINPDTDAWAKKYLGNKNRNIWKSTQSGGTSKPYIYTEVVNDVVTIKIRQDGKQGGKATVANSINQTVLGSVTTVDFPHAFAAKEEMKSWNFMQLNPEILREPTKQETNFCDVIGHSGENLAAALFRLKSDDEYKLIEISRMLRTFLPEFASVDVKDDKANKQFLLVLKDENGKEFTSRVLSEGTLRILTLCILLFDEKHQGLLCFEEPENGIHPFRINSMVKLLRDLSMDLDSPGTSLRQVIINTHSPSLLQAVNMMEEDMGISIWFSKLSTQITSVEGERSIMKVSKMVPLTKDLQLPFSDMEIKMTIADANRYLKTKES